MPTRNKLRIVQLPSLLALLCLVLLSNCSSGEKETSIRLDGFNLLIITLDTTRPDRIGAYGYTEACTPNLDGLAAEGILFLDAYSPVPITLPAHSSLFTGKTPPVHGVRTNGLYRLNEKERTLSEYFQDDGYQTQAVVASFVLLSRFGLGQGFDVYDDSLDPGELVRGLDSEISAERVYEKFKSRFNALNSSEPFFFWVHFYDPHSPYSPPGEFGQEYSGSPEKRYDGEIAYMDYYLGRILELLKSSGQDGKYPDHCRG